MSFHTLAKYLTQSPEKEIQLDLEALAQQWDYALCVPICGEAVNCLDRLLKHITNEKVLVIAVVNCPFNHAQSENWHQRNQLLMEYIKRSSTIIKPLSDSVFFLNYDRRFDLMLVDRSTEQRIDEKKGVGHARKIAADIALKLIYEKRVSKPWIFSTDADVVLPADYFSCISDSEVTTQTSALLLPFVHEIADMSHRVEQRMYDLKLYYYQAGIAFVAKSYAYVPLGSTLVISALAYAQVRGFPTRSAGEDFYILNKLAKVGQIYLPKKPLLKISSRISDRVPFGTGPAVNALTELKDLSNSPYYYHPQCFIMLKRWQTYLRDLWPNKLTEKPQNSMLKSLYIHLQLNKALNNSAKHIQNVERWKQFVHEWMDAFRMLKAVHFFSRNFAKVSLNELILTDDFYTLDTSGHLMAFIENEIKHG